MDLKLQQKIFNIAPILYTQKDWDKQKTCMCWGLECSDDWFNVIYNLSIELEKFNNDLNHKKWKLEIHATQVKEKWYSLRFYYDIISKEPFVDDKYLNELSNKIDKLIDEAEEKTIEIEHNKRKLKRNNV